MRARRLIVRLALLFATVQAIAIAGALLALPAIRDTPGGALLVLVLLLFNLALLVVFSGWLVQGAVSAPLDRLSADVHRIADGDYHHRVGDTHRPELLRIQDGVNQLADRLIADQQLLAENVRSLDETNVELRMVRDQVVRSARLASVGTLAAGIAHEVGNPLGAIMGFVDVARARVVKAGGDVEILDSIRGETQRIDRIVRGLLDYARPPAVAEAAAPAGDVVDRVRELLESQGKLQGIETSWEIDRASDHRIEEPHRLEQVLMNLLLNALHAIQGVDTPAIEVTVSKGQGDVVTMPRRRDDDPPGINYMHRRRRAQDEAGVGSVSTADRLILISVSDNGPGIPEEMVEHLFDPFFTTKAPGEGTGLGLSICARLIEGMGGDIIVERAGSGGARFVIRLPVMYDIAPEAAPADDSAATENQ